MSEQSTPIREGKQVNGIFSSLSEDEKDSWVSGKCMYLAAALHRRYGYVISVTLEDVLANDEIMHFTEAESLLVAKNDMQPYIGHAWVKVEKDYCLDIDGVYPESQNGWSTKRKSMVVVIDLNEFQLKALVASTCCGNLSDEQWEDDVSHALRLLDQHSGELRVVLNDRLSAPEADEMIGELTGLGMC